MIASRTRRGVGKRSSMPCDALKRSETHAPAPSRCTVAVSPTSRSWVSRHISLPSIKIVRKSLRGELNSPVEERRNKGLMSLPGGPAGAGQR
eukprot:9135320-Pyramimonas_sp.AAC.1